MRSLKSIGQYKMPTFGTRLCHLQVSNSLRYVAVPARRRVPDYTARRPGGDEENRRRSSDYYPSSETRAPSIPAKLQRKRSQDYTTRRSGGEEENARRRTGDRYEAPSRDAYSPSENKASVYEPPRRTPPMSPAVQRRRSVDYASRRSGGEEENRRRSSDYSTAPSTPSKPLQPPASRRTSIDYSSRRSNGEEENSRRRSAVSYQPPATPAAASFSTDYSRDSERRPIMPRRRVSADYSSRRSGGEEENQRRRSGDIPRAAIDSLREQPASPARPLPPRRRSSADYSSRRSGGEEENRRRSTFNRAPPTERARPTEERPTPARRASDDHGASDFLRAASNGVPPAANGASASRRASVQPQPRRRRSSADYAARRSGSEEENQRRRSADFKAGQVPSVDVQRAPAEPAPEGPPRRQKSPGGYAAAWQSSPKPTSYGSYGSYEEERSEPAPPARSSNAGRKVSGDHFLRDSYDGDSMAYSRDPAFDRTPDERYEATIAKPDWLALVLINIPAALGVLVAIIAADFGTHYEVTKLVIRYGGPGAPPFSVAPFWVFTLLAMGALSTIITNTIFPESFTLNGDCPECGAANKAKFGDVFRAKGEYVSKTIECRNCMAELDFELDTRLVTVVKGSVEKKGEALERGRLQALEEAKREAQAARDAFGP